MTESYLAVTGKRITEQEAIAAYNDGKMVIVYRSRDKESDKAYAGFCFAPQYGETLESMLKYGNHPDAFYTVK